MTSLSLCILILRTIHSTRVIDWLARLPHILGPSTRATGWVSCLFISWSRTLMRILLLIYSLTTALILWGIRNFGISRWDVLLSLGQVLVGVTRLRLIMPSLRSSVFRVILVCAWVGRMWSLSRVLLLLQGITRDRDSSIKHSFCRWRSQLRGRWLTMIIIRNHPLVVVKGVELEVIFYRLLLAWFRGFSTVLGRAFVLLGGSWILLGLTRVLSVILVILSISNHNNRWV